MEPPNVPHPADVPGKVAGKVKKMPKWAWIAGAVVLIGVAWFTMKRQTSDATALDPAQDPGTVADSSLFPGPTQGAFSGASDPTLDGGGTVDGGDGLDTAFTLLGFMQQHDADLLASIQPTPLQASDQAVPVDPATVATGGGPPGRTVTTHLAPPQNIVKDGKFYHVYNMGKGAKKGEKWVYVRPASTAAKHAPSAVAHSPQGTTTTGAHKSGPAGFPFHGPHGWYRVATRSGHTFHVYQSGLSLKVQ